MEGSLAFRNIMTIHGPPSMRLGIKAKWLISCYLFWNFVIACITALFHSLAGMFYSWKVPPRALYSVFRAPRGRKLVSSKMTVHSLPSTRLGIKAKWLIEAALFCIRYMSLNLWAWLVKQLGGDGCPYDYSLWNECPYEYTPYTCTVRISGPFVGRPRVRQSRAMRDACARIASSRGSTVTSLPLKRAPPLHFCLFVFHLFRSKIRDAFLSYLETTEALIFYQVTPLSCLSLAFHIFSLCKWL